MSRTPESNSIERLACPACGARMNPHAEKVAVPMTEAEDEDADWVLGGVIEEIHQCPACGHVQSRRVT
jgi:hypothetical protein